MRVLVIIPAHDWGGAERMAALVAIALRDRRDDVAVATAHPDSLGSELTGFPTVALPVDPARKVLAPLAVFRLRELRPDVIYTMHRWPTMLARFGRRSGVPVVYHAQSLVEPRPWIWWGDATIAVSQAVRDHVVAQGADRQRITVIPNAAVLHEPAASAVEEARRAIAQQVGTAVTALFAGRLVAGKGVDVLIDALPRVEGLGLVVLGRGDQEDALDRRAQVRGVRDRIWFAGWQDDVQVFARAVDIGVVPSDHYPEGLPLSALELMAAGLPVVVTNLSGLPEAITDESDGLVVDPGDVGALADALRRLVGDPTLRQELGRGATRTVASRFDAETVVHQVIDVITHAAG